MGTTCPFSLSLLNPRDTTHTIHSDTARPHILPSSFIILDPFLHTMSATYLQRSPAAGKPAKTTFVLDYSVHFSSSSHPESSSPGSSSSISSSIDNDDDDFLFDDASSISPSDEEADEADENDEGGDAHHTSKLTPSHKGSARLSPRSPQSSPYAMSLASSSRLSHRAATLPVASASTSASTSRSPQQPAADIVYSDFLSRQTRNRERRISNQMRSTRTTSQQPPRLAKKADENDHGDVLDTDLDAYGPNQASASLSPSTMLQSTADMPFSPEVLSWKLERFLRLSRQASPPQPRSIATMHSPAADLDVLSSATLARLADPSNGKVDEKNEKALKLAGWTKRGRAGVWEAPDDATHSLQALVASINS